MSQTTVNPYSEIGGYVHTGLDSILATLGAAGIPPTIDSLVNAVFDFIKPTFYATADTQTEIEIKSVARTAINSYVNSLVLSGNALYDGNQHPFIRMMMGDMITCCLPINSIANRLGDIEDNLTDSGLDVAEQRPLLVATSIGVAAYNYWLTEINKPLPPPPGVPSWPLAFPSQTEHTGNMIYLSYWTEAAINGSLSGYAVTPSGLIAPTINVYSTTMISALTAALTVTAGKVIFNWIPRIQHVV